MKQKSFLSASVKEQIVSMHWVCFDPDNSSFAADRPVLCKEEWEEQDVDDFVRFRVRSIDGQLYLSCYEVWEKGYNPLKAYASECSEDTPKLYEYQGRDFYVQACDIPVHELSNDSLEGMLNLMIKNIWEKNAFLRMLLDLDISKLHQECRGNNDRLQQAYEEAKSQYAPSRRFFSSEEF